MPLVHLCIYYTFIHAYIRESYFTGNVECARDLSSFWVMGSNLAVDCVVTSDGAFFRNVAGRQICIAHISDCEPLQYSS